MEALKSYPSYRDSGLPWMGQLPTSWQVIRSKYLFREVDDRTDTGTETLLSMRQAHGLIPHAKVSTKPVTPEELKGYRRVRAGQMVLNRMQASNGMFAMAREDGLVSPDYAVFQALQPMEPDFFVQLFKTSVYRAKFRQESKGLGTGTSGFLRLYSDRFGAIQVPNPSQDEQRRIVEFVRGYDLGVRRLIRNKRRLIGLLNEQKQAIINQAVTRGLNPNVPMKPTGIDWMPEVPAHWEVKPLKHWLRERAKALGDKTSPEYEFDYLDISCVGTGFLTSKPERMKFENAPSRARQIVQKGDTILSTVRTYLKAVYFIENDWPDLIASTGFAVLRPVEQVEPRLLGYVLQSSTFIERVIRASIGVAYPAISEGRLGMLHVAFSPHLAEQKAILDHIAAETAAFDEAIEKAQSEITLIREYRERLIADVVTGKLDVRNVEIAEPAEEPIADGEPLEEEGDDTEVLEGADAEE
jgi:type I restriction enzyme S subunit